ncbi:MAG: helix-turn-helix transcriptional regulator [Rhodospirillales bacterium]|jgi:AraC-like DNA-binding protein|nr:helix-turn-helix transcriptional regulator [Rhodospirillales bacterium]MBT4625602.1 helix-turn-helix transcriptional regulator [Rhodospirillales bacterium]MBT5351485.1 helix-turn-helix transcriptional regulator [Rhodospirillales bacterium]MBT5521432.1 helix-turn-helix transcriptional regulator [Rhodospirillales bacterium]MBT6110395.1 helix-turn-helix transcriptional regulator [Rhodospirillales bacterium]
MSYEHIFDEMQIDTTPFALCELHGKCDLGIGRLSGATLHYILSGRGEIIFQDEPRIAIKQGSLVLVPAHKAHTLRSFGETGEPIPSCRPAELDLERHLAKDARTESDGVLLAICGDVKVGLRGASGLVDLIREPIVEHIDENSSLYTSVVQLLSELASPTIGSRAMVRALLLQCMIYLLRKRLVAQDTALNWMTALIDEGLWNALRLMLDNPGHCHSVESLADVAGMSRSSFAERFSTAYGSGPMKLLRRLRMNLACSMLVQSNLPVKRIAERVGFSSRSAFTRAFETVTGMSPRRFRATRNSVQ